MGEPTGVTVFGYRLFNLVNKIVVFIIKFRILKNKWRILFDLIKLVILITEVFNQRLVLRVVDPKFYGSIGQLRQLDGLLEKSNASFLECDAPDTFIINFLNSNFSSTHFFLIFV